ncbi:Cytochrome P450 71A9 [Hordeum vulgare]|uniref:cytochrome P450 71A1-like n=1 Tax=Hordeum vulgare subsp. vulgare TaxID=112509 RepID=UPI001B859354|nr:cytochrome P450 71A1-like [Hordeum vulgare subsp. vulgare]KAE8813794.1 Cytochrome P450 71A9 [Hordeum vulgare]
MSPYAVLVAAAAVVVAFCYVTKKAPSKNSKLPPSPPCIPLLGHLHLLGRLAHRSLRDLHARYGSDGGLLLLQLGRRRTLVVSTAAAAADLYKNHDLAFASRVLSAPVHKLSYGSINVSFAPYGDAWRRSKKMAVVHLLSQRRADSFAPVRAAEAAALVARVRRAAEAGEAVELRELLYGYGNAVVTRAATGAAGATAERMKQLMGNSAALMSGLQAEDVLPDAAAKVVRWATGFERRLDDQMEAWHKFLSEIIAEHLEKKKKKKCDDGAGEEDFLDVLLRLREEGTAGLDLTDDRIISIVQDMIFAGTETSSITLEWAMAELTGSPNTMAKLRDEVTRVANGKSTIEEDDISRMEYLKAVMKEVLRLHPPAPLLIPHESTATSVVQGYEIPAKTALFINAWAIGRDPVAWGDTTEEFWPERFLANGNATDVDVRGNDYQLLPFGAGRRLCPAINFAMPTLEIALACLVRQFDWDLPLGTCLEMGEAPGLTTPPSTPLRLVPRCMAT